MTDQEILDLFTLAKNEGLTCRELLAYDGDNDPSRADLVAMTRRLTGLCEAALIVWKYTEGGATKRYFLTGATDGRFHTCAETEDEKAAPGPLPPTVEKSDYAPHASRSEQRSEVPAYLKGFRGIQASVEREPDCFEQVVQVLYSHDGKHFDPIRLSATTLIRVGEAIPHWFNAATCVALTHIYALSVKYRKGSEIMEVRYDFPSPYTLFYGEEK